MWKEYFIYGFNKTLSAGSGTLYESQAVRIDSDADFEWHKLCYQSTNGNVRAKVQDDAIGRYLFKTNADLRAIAGNSIQTPFIWPRPYVISAGTTLTWELADNSGVSNTVRLAMHGAKIRPGEDPFRRHYRALVPFVYGTGKQTVSGNGTSSIRIEIDRDSHFLVQKITGWWQGSSLLTIKEGSRDRDWMNTAIQVQNILGTGQYPNVMYANRFIMRASVVVVQVQDLTGSSNDIEIDLVGVKLYE